MAARINVAVMHCTKNEPEKTIDCGLSVKENMYANTTEYPSPPKTQPELEAKLTAAANTQALVKDGGKQEKANRDAAVGELHAMLENELLPYVNGLYKGDKAKLLLSGFAVSNDPTPHDIPPAPIIKKIENGPEPHSVKIYLIKNTGALNTKRERLTYFVWMSEAMAGEENMKIVCTTTSQHKLIVTGLTRGKEYVFAVSCRNAAGGAELSGKVRSIAN